MTLTFKKIRKPGKARWLSLVFFGLVLFSSFLEAAPNPPKMQYNQDNSAVIKEIKVAVDDIRHEVGNQQAEIRMHDEKFKNVDAIIEHLRDQVEDSAKFYKEQLKNNLAGVDAKLVSLDKVYQGVVQDIRQFQAHSKDTASILEQYKQKITEMEKVIDQQNQNIGHLQAALQSLMDALQGHDQGHQPLKHVPSGNSYKVKQGDSLEKIARSHQTTIQAIKEVNGLTTDRIVVGKTLIIPEK